MRESIAVSTNHNVGTTDGTPTRLPNQHEFLAAVESRFAVSHEGRAAEFTLVECNGLLSNENQECYSLVFLGPAEAPPAQGIYLLQNDTLGTFELFLVPIKRDDKGLYFEAVMNHLLSS